MSILPGTTTQPWTSFDIAANCSLTGNYFAWVVTQDNEPPFPEVAKFWRMTVGLEGAQNLSDTVVIEWHEWARSNRSDLVYQVNILDACRNELCRSIGSEIDGGLAGFGVSPCGRCSYLLLYVHVLTRPRSSHPTAWEPSC